MIRTTLRAYKIGEITAGFIFRDPLLLFASDSENESGEGKGSYLHQTVLEV